LTYQVGFRATDGLVIASDQRELLEIGPGDEGTGSKTNMVRKIQIDHKGRFAWCYAGGEIGPYAVANVGHALNTGDSTTDSEIKLMLEDCGNRSWDHARGPNSGSTLLLLDGQAKTIWRAKLSRMTIVEQLEGGVYFAGQYYSNSSFFPRHFYATDMTVSELSMMAAYAVKMAHVMDPLCVAGLDIAAYLDVTGKFEFLDGDAYGKEANILDGEIGKLFRKNSSGSGWT
jgi:hypothetical protein